MANFGSAQGFMAMEGVAGAGGIPGIGGATDPVGSAYNQNVMNYGNILKAYQDSQQNIQQQMTGIQQGYGNLQQQVLGQIQGVGASQRQAINDAYAHQQGASTQSLLNRGLGNTTVVDSANRGLFLDKNKADIALANQMAQLQAGYTSQLGMAGLGAQMQGLGLQANLGQAYMGDLSHYQLGYPPIGGGRGGGGGKGGNPNPGFQFSNPDAPLEDPNYQPDTSWTMDPYGPSGPFGGAMYGSDGGYGGGE